MFSAASILHQVYIFLAQCSALCSVPRYALNFSLRSALFPTLCSALCSLCSMFCSASQFRYVFCSVLCSVFRSILSSLFCSVWSIWVFRSVLCFLCSLLCSALLCALLCFVLFSELCAFLWALFRPIICSPDSTIHYPDLWPMLRRLQGPLPCPMFRVPCHVVVAPTNFLSSIRCSALFSDRNPHKNCLESSPTLADVLMQSQSSTNVENLRNGIPVPCTFPLY